MVCSDIQTSMKLKSRRGSDEVQRREFVDLGVPMDI